MKGFHKILSHTSILGTLIVMLGMSQRAEGQCLYSADYYTYNNFCDLDSLYLTAHPLNGSPPYTYLWETGETTQTISIPLALDDYLVTITDSEGCSIVINCHVKPNPQVLSYPFNQNACLGDTVNLLLDWYRDSIPGALYEWSTGETTPSILITDDITWSVTVTDPSNGCEYIIPPSFFDFHPVPFPEIVGPSTLCFGESIILTVTGGPFGDIVWFPYGIYDDSLEVVWPETIVVWTSSPEANYCWHQDSIVITEGEINPPLLSGPSELCTGQSGTITVTNSSEYITFAWSTNQSNPSITVSQPGTYSVTVTNEGGCTATESITIDPGSSNMVINGSISSYSSCLQPNGAVDISITPPGSYDYEWSNGSTIEDISNLSPGTYTITVTDSGGCTATEDFVVEDNTVAPDPSGTPTSSTCNLSNGSIDLSVSPPGSYTFMWSNGMMTEDLTGILAGSYSVTVTSTTSGCTAVSNFTVDNNNPPIVLSGDVTPLTSCTASNGAIDISVSPGGSYTYLWSNGASTEDLNNLVSGNYTVTVSAGGSCTATNSYTVPDNTNAPVFSLTPTPSSCGQNNGSVDLNNSSGGNYTYIWTNGAITEDISSINAGLYGVTVTDMTTNCSAAAEIAVADEQIMIGITGIPEPNTSCTGANGSIDIQINPPGAYAFAWSNAETSEDIIDLTAGAYSVTVTLGSTCTQSALFNVTDESVTLLISGQVTPNSSCAQPNGAIDITVNPVDTYTYSWSNGETTEDINALTGGTYSITVSNGDGCTSTASFDVTNSNSTYSVTADIDPNNSCILSNGSIDLSVSPVGNYLYAWTNGSINEDIDQLPSGNYGVTVTDENNCSSVFTFVVSDSLQLPSISAQTTPDICGHQNGTIDLSVVPTNGNSFLWSNGSMNEDLQNLASGTYTISVTAANGCSASQSIPVELTSPTFTSSGQVLPNRSCVNPDGRIDLSVAPMATYTFLWSTLDTVEDLAEVPAGTYTVLITDNNQCAVSDTFTIPDSIILPLITSIITPSSCGMPNGMIDITANPTLHLRYSWSNGGTTEDQGGLYPGTYFITVTDTITACAILDTFTVPNINSNFSVSNITIPNTSCISSNGSIDLTVTPAGVYVFSWSNGAMTEDISALTAGTYTVTITDPSLCASIETYAIVDNTPRIELTPVITPASCGQSNGSIVLTANPSTGNAYLWSSGQTTKDITDLSAGTYTVTVTGLNGCVTIDTFLITNQGSTITLTGNTIPNTSCSVSNGAIDLMISPFGVYSYAWSNGQTTEDISGLTAGQYTVTVTDMTQCISSATFIIDDQAISPALVATIIPSICGNPNGTIELTVTPADNYTYTWSNGAAAEDLVNILAGQYSLTVTGPGGCSTDTLLEVGNTGVTFNLGALVTGNSSCTTANGLIDLTITPAGNYAVLWSTGDTTEDLTNLKEGIYSVTVTDISGCSTADQYTVQDQTTPLAVEPLIIPAQCGQPNGAIYLQVTPDTGNTFLWSNGMQTGEIENLLAGPYEVTVTNNNGCNWSSIFQVDGNSSFEIQLEANVSSSQSGYVTITLSLNIDVGAIDSIIWSPEDLFSCPEKICLEQTIPYPLSRKEINVLAIDTNGCQSRAALTLESLIGPEVYIPNVFSPNGDGINDLFTIYGNKDVELVDVLQIFDRWGNQVFINTSFPANDERHGWDGALKGEAMNPAVFVYWARVLYTDGTTGSFKGDITLVK
jgi:gliding motility-associated-like protein